MQVSNSMKQGKFLGAVMAALMAAGGQIADFTRRSRGRCKGRTPGVKGAFGGGPGRLEAGAPRNRKAEQMCRVSRMRFGLEKA